MIFRRPELEKDNPIAPEPYVGPRRRLAMARAAASDGLSEIEAMKETLQTLVDAASWILRGLPKVKEPDKRVKALRNAIAKANRVLVAQNRSKSSNKAKN